jgi:hypothetical protein
MSTTVIVEGDETLLTQVRRFACPFCNALFDTDSYSPATLGDEGELGALTYLASQDRPGVAAFATCPTCGNKAVSVPGVNGLAPTSVALTVQTLPAKCIYTPGDYFDPTGLELGLKMSNGVISPVDLSDCTLDPDTDTALDEDDVKITVTHTASGNTVEIPISVRNQVIPEVQLVNGDFVYTGSSQQVEVRYFNSDTSTRSGYSKTSAGEYTATYTPKTGYCWPDGSTDALEIPWVIHKAVPVVVPPAPKTGLAYTGGPIYIATSGSTSGGTMVYKLGAMSWSPDMVYVVHSGTFTFAWRVDGGSNYVSNPGDSFEVTVDKGTPEVTAPTPVEDLAYTGEAQALVSAGSTTLGTLLYSTDGENYDDDLPTGTDNSDYTVYYKVDGTQDIYAVPPATVTATIAKATQTASLSVDTLSLTAIATPGTITVTRDGGGAVTAESSDETVCTVSVEDTTVTVTAVADGTATVTVHVAASEHYVAAEDQTCAVTVALV